MMEDGRGRLRGMEEEKTGDEEEGGTRRWPGVDLKERNWLACLDEVESIVYAQIALTTLSVLGWLE